MTLAQIGGIAMQALFVSWMLDFGGVPMWTRRRVYIGFIACFWLSLAAYLLK